MLKKFFALLFVLLLLAGCSNPHEYQESIFGDDSKLADQADSFTYQKQVLTQQDNQINHQFTRFSGMRTLERISAKAGDTLTITYTASVTRGKLKGILITPSGEVIPLWEWQERTVSS